MGISIIIHQEINYKMKYEVKEWLITCFSFLDGDPSHSVVGIMARLLKEHMRFCRETNNVANMHFLGLARTQTLHRQTRYYSRFYSDIQKI